MIDAGLVACMITLVISAIVHWYHNPIEHIKQVFYETEDFCV
jgi:hypothetical protein